MRQISRFFTFSLFLLFAAACRPEQNPALPEVPYLTAINCVEILNKAQGKVDCRPIETAELILQAANADRVILQTDGISITFDSTIYIQATPGETLTVAAFEGSAVISSNGITRVASAGMQVRVPLDEGLASTFAPLAAEPFEYQSTANIPFDELTRPIQIEPTEITPAPTSLPTYTPQNDCDVPPANWSGQYVIQRGDNLTRIANLFDTTTALLQQYNCLENPNRIRPGDTLLVPEVQTNEVEAAAPPVTPVNTIGTASFVAERTLLPPGDCTTLTWDTTNAQLVYYENQPTSHSGVISACPDATTTYTLRVLFIDGNQEELPLTIEVSDS